MFKFPSPIHFSHQANSKSLLFLSNQTEPRIMSINKLKRERGKRRRENSPHASEKMREPRRNVSTELHLYTSKQWSPKQNPESRKDWPYSPAYSITKWKNDSEWKRIKSDNENKKEQNRRRIKALTYFGSRKKHTFPQITLNMACWDRVSRTLRLPPPPETTGTRVSNSTKGLPLFSVL